MRRVGAFGSSRLARWSATAPRRWWRGHSTAAQSRGPARRPGSLPRRSTTPGCSTTREPTKGLTTLLETAARPRHAGNPDQQTSRRHASCPRRPQSVEIFRSRADLCRRWPPPSEARAAGSAGACRCRRHVRRPHDARWRFARRLAHVTCGRRARLHGPLRIWLRDLSDRRAGGRRSRHRLSKRAWKTPVTIRDSRNRRCRTLLQCHCRNRVRSAAEHGTGIAEVSPSSAASCPRDTSCAPRRHVDEVFE